MVVVWDVGIHPGCRLFPPISFERHRKELLETDMTLREIVEPENDIIFLVGAEGSRGISHVHRSCPQQLEGSDFVRRVESRTLVSYVADLQANFPPPLRVSMHELKSDRLASNPLPHHPDNLYYQRLEECAEEAAAQGHDG